MKKELEEAVTKVADSLNLNSQERRLVGLMGPFLQVLFVDCPQPSQTKVLKLFYDFQLIKEKMLSANPTESEGKGTP